VTAEDAVRAFQNFVTIDLDYVADFTQEAAATLYPELQQTSGFLVNASLFATSSIERAGCCWLWSRGFAASQAQSWGQRFRLLSNRRRGNGMESGRRASR